MDFSTKTEVQLNVRLKQTILQGQAVVITAQMRGQVAAINEQVSSKTIVNVVSEEKIKELPDANAAEAIGRLPGVSLIRSGGEATKVVLRGLSSKFSNITVDGVKIPSTDSTSRDVDLSTISQGELAGIELSQDPHTRPGWRRDRRLDQSGDPESSLGARDRLRRHGRLQSP